MKRRVFGSILLALCLGPMSMLAQAEPKSDPESRAKDLVITVFETVDADNNDKLSVGELSNMSESIFVSMDYDDNAKIARDEFMVWDFGLINISAEAGEEDTFRAAKRILFAIRDLNSDGVIDEDEERLNVMSDFNRADVDSNGALSQAEYLKSYMPTLVFKAAFEIGTQTR